MEILSDKKRVRPAKIRIHYLQHVPFEGPGQIETWALSRRHKLSATHLYGREPLPSFESFDWLVVMGGPMNVDEESLYPWLVDEKRFIAGAIEHGKTVLGVCLGAQLIAAAAGARIYANAVKEIGWFPVRMQPEAASSSLHALLPRIFPAFHWHGDTFDIPKGAAWLAASDGCPNQAFALGDHVLALQFHLESTVRSVEKLIAHCGREIVQGPFIQEASDMIAAEDNFRQTNRILEGILAHFEKQTIAR